MSTAGYLLVPGLFLFFPWGRSRKSEVGAIFLVWCNSTRMAFFRAVNVQRAGAHAHASGRGSILCLGYIGTSRGSPGHREVNLFGISYIRVRSFFHARFYHESNSVLLWVSPSLYVSPSLCLPLSSSLYPAVFPLEIAPHLPIYLFT